MRGLPGAELLQFTAAVALAVAVAAVVDIWCPLQTTAPCK